MAENKTRSQSRVLRIAAMDFALCPLPVMEKELNCHRKQIYMDRGTDLYRETVEELREAWKEAMLRTPGTSELRKEINYGLSISVKKLIHILSHSKTPNRDLIAAARLMAQMDGRFLGSESADLKPGVETESVAQELITMVQRARGSDKVQ